MQNPHPRINTYADALKIYEETKPARGDEEKHRPFFKPRRKHLDIFKYENGDISVRANKQDLVVFKPDSTFVIPEYTGYVSRSYAKLVSLILRSSEWCFKNQHGRLWLFTGGGNIVPIGEHDVVLSRNYVTRSLDTLDKNGVNKFEFIYESTLRVHEGDYVEVTKLDLTKLNKIRNTYFRAFSKYLKGATKIRDKDKHGEYEITQLELSEAGVGSNYLRPRFAFQPPASYVKENPEYKAHYEESISDYAKLYNDFFDTVRYEDYHKAFLWLAQESSTHYWRHTRKFKMSSVQNTFKKILLLAYSDQIFYKEKVKVKNKTIADPYAKYLNLYGIELIDRKPLT